MSDPTITTAPVEVSPSRSFKGWRLGELLRRNKDKLKLAVAALGGYVVAESGKIANPDLNALASTLAGAVVYVLASAVDFYLSDVPPDPNA